MFQQLPYEEKIQVCRLYYRYNLNTESLPNILKENIGVHFSWNKVVFENMRCTTEVKRIDVEKWFQNNIKIIRKHKLLSITKRETVI